MKDDVCPSFRDCLRAKRKLSREKALLLSTLRSIWYTWEAGEGTFEKDGEKMAELARQAITEVNDH